MTGRRQLFFFLIIANWIVFMILATVIGGAALDGEITDTGEYLVRMQPSEVGIPVGEQAWTISLVYSFLTIGLSPLLVVLNIMQRPSRGEPGGALRRIAILLSLMWLLVIGIKALQRMIEYGSKL